MHFSYIAQNPCRNELSISGRRWGKKVRKRNVVRMRKGLVMTFLSLGKSVIPHYNRDCPIIARNAGLKSIRMTKETAGIEKVLSMS